jgi:hypothetical protein
LWGAPILLSTWLSRVLSYEVRHPELEAAHLPPTTAEIKIVQRIYIYNSMVIGQLSISDHCLMLLVELGVITFLNYLTIGWGDQTLELSLSMSQVPLSQL